MSRFGGLTSVNLLGDNLTDCRTQVVSQEEKFVTSPLAEEIKKILYATEEGFEVPEVQDEY